MELYFCKRSVNLPDCIAFVIHKAINPKVKRILVGPDEIKMNTRIVCASSRTFPGFDLPMSSASNAYYRIGKQFISSIIKKPTPSSLYQRFYKEYLYHVDKARQEGAPPTDIYNIVPFMPFEEASKWVYSIMRNIINKMYRECDEQDIDKMKISYAFRKHKHGDVLVLPEEIRTPISELVSSLDVKFVMYPDKECWNLFSKKQGPLKRGSRADILPFLVQ
jgi:uncharacterized UPF0160 family protein